MSENANPNGPDAEAVKAPDAEAVEAPAAEAVESPDEESLGDAGKKALTTERAARKEAERARDEALAEVKRLQRANAAVKGTDVDAIKADIRAEFAGQLAEAALRAEAKGRLANPAVITKFADVASLHGADEAAIKAAVDKVLQDEPYLAAPESGTKPWGNVGGGATPSTKPEPSSPMDRMRRAYGNTNK